jgi:hypothetical protein
MAENPYVIGSKIGRARADLLDRYDREEEIDPRARLELIDKLLDELLATWGTHPMAQEHVMGIKTGIEDGLKDREFMHSKIKAVDEGKKKKIMKDIIDEKKFGEKMQPKEDKKVEEEKVQGPAWLGKKISKKTPGSK